MPSSLISYAEPAKLGLYRMVAGWVKFRGAKEGTMIERVDHPRAFGLGFQGLLDFGFGMPGV